MEQNTKLGWLLDDLTERVEHVRHALVLSNDGLVTGASKDFGARTPNTWRRSRRVCTVWPRAPAGTSAPVRYARR